MFKIQKGYDSESKTFRLPVELIEQLEKLAAQNKLSLNQLVVQLPKLCGFKFRPHRPRKRKTNSQDESGRKRPLFVYYSIQFF